MALGDGDEHRTKRSWCHKNLASAHRWLAMVALPRHDCCSEDVTSFHLSSSMRDSLDAISYGLGIQSKDWIAGIKPAVLDFAAIAASNPILAPLRIDTVIDWTVFAFVAIVKMRWWQLPWILPPEKEQPGEYELAALREKKGYRLQEMAAAKLSSKLIDLENEAEYLKNLFRDKAFYSRNSCVYEDVDEDEAELSHLTSKLKEIDLSYTSVPPPGLQEIVPEFVIQRPLTEKDYQIVLGVERFRDILPACRSGRSGRNGIHCHEESAKLTCGNCEFDGFNKRMFLERSITGLGYQSGVSSRPVCSFQLLTFVKTISKKPKLILMHPMDFRINTTQRIGLGLALEGFTNKIYEA
ncbi:hypothetical protein SELMODRAFT_432131 [Selaginella moellendorffii]|uniref:Uncharacterized protein n=1 Tax=Selaginella moellendorffii TaxID=88036 RepID=D8TF27_SELML|nr:hypothetical protein SELMODRAFT_432131 [Selaginella moellendorffii]